MARHARHEEHVNHEAWAIPYGDLITLLLAFFVVMYAISTLNEGKYRVMSDSLNAAFDGVPRSIAPIQIGQPTEASSIAPPQPFENDPGSPDVVNLSERVRADAVITPIELMQLEQQQAQADIQLDAIQRQVERALGPLIMSDQVTVSREGLWVEVNIRSDVLFASGSAALSTPARDAIDQLGQRCASCRTSSASRGTPTTSPSPAPCTRPTGNSRRARRQRDPAAGIARRGPAPDGGGGLRREAADRGKCHAGRPRRQSAGRAGDPGHDLARAGHGRAQSCRSSFAAAGR